MKNDITEIANRIAKPKETELFKFGDVKVCKFPLKFNDGKVVNNLNYYEQMELLKILSKKWNVKVRHLTLEENFKLVHSKEGKEYMKNVLTPHWIYTGEFVKRGDDISNFKKSCDKWCYECYDEKGNSAIRCYWYSGEQGLLAFTGRPLYRYDVGVLSICFENQLKIKEKPEHMRNKPEKEGKSSVTMTSNEDRIRINAIPNDALPSESLPKECNCEHRKELSDIVMPFPVTKAGWYCPVHGWVDYKKSDKPEIEAQSSEVLEASLTSKRNRLATSQNGKASSESILTILRDIIAHGNWKYLLEVYGKLESGKEVGSRKALSVAGGSSHEALVGQSEDLRDSSTKADTTSSEISGLNPFNKDDRKKIIKRSIEFGHVGIMNGGLKRWTEKIAELEHRQWQEWRTKMEAEFIETNRILPSKWLLTGYGDLPEMIKEEDRIYARKVIEVIAGDVEKLLDEFIDEYYPDGKDVEINEIIIKLKDWVNLKKKLGSEKK